MLQPRPTEQCNAAINAAINAASAMPLSHQTLNRCIGGAIPLPATLLEAAVPEAFVDATSPAVPVEALLCRSASSSEEE